MRGLEEKQTFTERIVLLSKIDCIDSVTKSAQRISSLVKSGYSIVDTYIENGEQLFALEKAEI